MKIVNIILFFLFLIFKSFAFAETKIAFVDIDAIIYGSDVGKTMNKNFEKSLKDNDTKFKKLENELKKKETDILNKKNILSETELNEKVSQLRKEINSFQKERGKANDNFRRLRLEQTNKLLQELNKILANYAEKESISIVIQKKNIVMGKTEFDITSEVFDIFNKEVRSIK